MNRVSVPSDLIKSQNEAISNMDFESAYALSKKILDFRKQTCEDLQTMIFAQMDADNAQHTRNYELECESIQLKQERESRAIKQEFKRTAMILAEKHRNEAKALEKKWRALFMQAIEDAESRTQTAKKTARILAQCDMYDKAISLRDNIKNDDKCAKECLEGFKRQYKLMTERHEHEFDQLHLSIKNYMTVLRKQSKEMKIAANAAKVAEESQHNAVAINSVFDMTNDESIRKSAIDKYSPHCEPAILGFR